MKYFAKAGKDEIQIDINSESVCINGEDVTCALRPIGHSLHLLTLNGRSYEVFCREKNGDYEVSFSNLKLAVTVEDEKSRALKKLIKVEDDGLAELEIKAPMPGLITEINVKQGDRVRNGQGLAVIEAMKMENEICAPADGMVAQIRVTEKTSVDKESVLFILQK